MSKSGAGRTLKLSSRACWRSSSRSSTFSSPTDPCVLSRAARARPRQVGACHGSQHEWYCDTIAKFLDPPKGKSVRVARAAPRRERSRRAARIETIEALVGEVAEEHRIAGDDIGGAAILMDARAHVVGRWRHLLNRTVSAAANEEDRKSTRLNSSHTVISYAVFCLENKRT